VTHTIPKLNENEKKKHLDALQLPLLTDIFLVVPLCFAKEYVERPDTRTHGWSATQSAVHVMEQGVAGGALLRRMRATAMFGCCRPSCCC
jgi:hypothetical protein